MNQWLPPWVTSGFNDRLAIFMTPTAGVDEGFKHELRDRSELFVSRVVEHGPSKTLFLLLNADWLI
ncbi:MAG: hypothetical protein CBB79_09480 [Synechococcus sp. TMED19]|nr:MAG: hypothetical protein CBB79_09480 [Synechococcus sp. TMED19]